MELTITANELKPKYKKQWATYKLHLHNIKFHMFNWKTRLAIRLVGSATFRSGDFYERITP